MSAAIAIQSVAIPSPARTMKAALTAREKKMFWRMTPRTRREYRTSHGSFERSSDISAMSAVSIAASVFDRPDSCETWPVPIATPGGRDRAQPICELVEPRVTLQTVEPPGRAPH